ncbi:hypothetical protein DFH27DRAFT_308289 [Peziza echinospora]|nr:hypothetical protein DFH27DRAFT_308289 [Peziza echinospora]
MGWMDGLMGGERLLSMGGWSLALIVSNSEGTRLNSELRDALLNLEVLEDQSWHSSRAIGLTGLYAHPPGRLSVCSERELFKVPCRRFYCEKAGKGGGLITQLSRYSTMLTSNLSCFAKVHRQSDHPSLALSTRVIKGHETTSRQSRTSTSRTCEPQRKSAGDTNAIEWSDEGFEQP